MKFSRAAVCGSPSARNAASRLSMDVMWIAVAATWPAAWIRVAVTRPRAISVFCRQASERPSGREKLSGVFAVGPLDEGTMFDMVAAPSS